MRNKPLAKSYSLAEEIANSISHSVGVIFGIIGLILVLNHAGEVGATALAVTSYSFYGGSMILLHLASMLYHVIPHPQAKRWLKRSTTARFTY